MAQPKIPKKKPEPENDKLNREEAKGYNSRKKLSEERKEKLKDKEVKDKLMDYIFSKSEENPLQ